jgi:hypothetical protein
MGLMKNKSWQVRLWEELLEREPLLPPRGGSLLVIGNPTPAEMVCAGDLLVAHCEWREPVAKGLAYDRVLLVADRNMPDAELALARAAGVLARDGRVVVVAARGWPWGTPDSVWGSGMRFGVWKKLLRAGGWKLEYAHTAGVGGAAFLRWVPGAGMVRVMVASKNSKGGGLRVVEPQVLMRGKVAVAG